MENENDGPLGKKLEQFLKVMEGLTEVTNATTKLAGGLTPEKKGVLACFVIASAALAVVGLKSPIPAVIAEVILFLGAAILIGWKRQ